MTDTRDPLEKAVDRAAVARRVRNAENTILEQHAEIEQLRAALWPFAMKALKGTAVCIDDYRRAGETMPHAPDHVVQQPTPETKA